MIHVDIFYDYQANQMHATLETGKGVPSSRPCRRVTPSIPGPIIMSCPTRPTACIRLEPGGVFTPPKGRPSGSSAEHLSGLENYDGPGNKMENPPRPYTPILGTAGP